MIGKYHPSYIYCDTVKDGIWNLYGLADCFAELARGWRKPG
jgi:hypothetical protein